MPHTIIRMLLKMSIPTVASYPGAQGGGERAPGSHCLHMRLISQISEKIVYFSNLLCYVDVIIN